MQPGILPKCRRPDAADLPEDQCWHWRQRAKTTTLRPRRKPKMINRTLPALLLLLLFSWPLRAQTNTSATTPEMPQTLEQAADQRARAAQMITDADQTYATEQAACYKKFLVNG